jgi:cold shock CspA family protein
MTDNTHTTHPDQPAESEQREIKQLDNFGPHVGLIKWFNNSRGYGFLRIVSQDRNGDDIFVHQTNVVPHVSGYRTLKEGEYVSFELSDEDRPQALNITGVFGGPLMCDAPAPTRPTRGGNGGAPGGGRGRGRRPQNSGGDGEGGDWNTVGSRSSN